MERIVVDSKVHFGKPCVAGTRITVQNVLELVNEGISFQEITQDYYPDLTVDDVRACIQYAIAVQCKDRPMWNSLLSLPAKWVCVRGKKNTKQVSGGSRI